MSPAATLALVSRGQTLDTSPACYGELRSSRAIVADAAALRQRMQTDGYLYLPGFLDRPAVLRARAVIAERLACRGCLDERYPVLELVCKPGVELAFNADLATDNPALDAVLYAGRLMQFYEHFLGGPVRHFDFTWFRSISPGEGTNPHCDLVYMGRGTRNLYTAWVPIGDVSYEIGGLMILEKSNQQADRLRRYLERDVDTYCRNGRFAAAIESGQRVWEWDGALSRNPVSLREKLGGRWLSAEYRAGDLLTFGMETVHASLDNRSDRIRISSDSRYQLAAEPADERWIGPNPIRHGVAGKRGRIC